MYDEYDYQQWMLCFHHYVRMYEPHIWSVHSGTLYIVIVQTLPNGHNVLPCPYEQSWHWKS